MSKVAKSFRLDPVAVDYLNELTTLTGSNQAAIIEQSLAIYRSLLLGGLSGPRRILASTTPPEVAEPGIDVPPKSKQPKRPARERLSEARGARRRALVRELAQPAAETLTNAQPPPYQLEAGGHVYTFEFPVTELPEKGSAACPCGSGKAFAQCHPKEFEKALATGGFRSSKL